MGVLGITLKVLLAVVVLVVLAVGIAYAADAPVEATVTAKQCGSGFAFFGSAQGPRTITVKTRIGGVAYTLHDVPDAQCQAVQVQNFVRYHVRSHRTILYQTQGGACIYDSATSPASCG